MLDDLKGAAKAWAARLREREGDIFTRLGRGQAPQILWIGCSDSRVPPEAILGLGPGEVFVHRNVANLAEPDDPSWSAVLQYAVEVLRVRHVLVVGHTGCGGVAAALRGEAPAAVATWLRPLRDTATTHRAELDACPDDTARQMELTRLNVARQVGNVAASPSVRAAWDEARPLSVHGWVYVVEEGRVLDLELTVSGP